MNDKEFLKKSVKMINDILRTHIEMYFDNNPTPDNIKLIEEYVNKFLFEKFLINGYRFELELSSKEPGQVTVEGVKSFKNGVRI